MHFLCLTYFLVFPGKRKKFLLKKMNKASSFFRSIREKSVKRSNILVQDTANSPFVNHKGKDVNSDWLADQ